MEMNIWNWFLLMKSNTHRKKHEELSRKIKRLKRWMDQNPDDYDEKCMKIKFSCLKKNRISMI